MSDARPHRVVIDPNVFISATITPNGALGSIIRLIDDGTLVPVVTQHLVDEVVDVLGRPKLRMRRLGEWHADVVVPPAVTRDPNDDYLVALALATHAEALTSGDDDLHAAKHIGIEVLTPRELLKRMGP